MSEQDALDFLSRFGDMSPLPPDDPRWLFERAADAFSRRVHAIDRDQWGLGTPCGEWDVRALVAHVVSECAWIPELLGGRTVDEVGDQLDGDLLGVAPVDVWDRVAAEARRAVSHCPDLDRPVHLSHGDVAAGGYITQMFAELLIHGWDLARCTRADEHLDPSLVQRCTAWFTTVAGDYRAAGVVAELPPGSSSGDAQSALLALFGRA